MFALSENQRLYWNIQTDHVYLYDRLYVTQALLFPWRVWFGVGLRRVQVPFASDGWFYKTATLRWDDGSGWSVSNGMWSPVTSVRVVCAPPNYAHSPLFAPTMLLLHLLLSDEDDFTSLLHWIHSILCSWVRTEKLWCEPKNWTVGHGNLLIAQLTRFPKNWKPV